MDYPKRIFDVILATVLLVVTFPLVLLCSLIVLTELRSNPFFVQERGLSLAKHRFNIYKLRTVKNKHRMSTTHEDESDIFMNPSLVPSVPPFCRWLRKTGIDELPQLLNILLGDMSFIGPRPLSIGDLQQIKRDYPEYYSMREQLNSKPGFSGLWQIYGNRDEGVKNIIELDMLYEDRKSFVYDLRLIAKSIPIMLFARHSDAIVRAYPQKPSAA